MRKQDKNSVLAVFTSDWHLHHAAPSLREKEPDWYSAMNRAVGEVLALAEYHNAPILLCGDVFQKPIEPPELVNWVIKRLSRTKVAQTRIFSVPGQHDLEHHSLENIKRTSYWTLVEAGVMMHVSERRPLEVQFAGGVPTLTLHAFPWGVEPRPREGGPSNDFNRDIAMVHRYYWTRDTGYENAPTDRWLGHHRELFATYDAVGIGDNHAHFISGNVINCGCLMRRRSDEMNYEPSIGLLRLDGDIERYKLDVSRDVYSVNVAKQFAIEEDNNLYEEFVGKLKALSVSAVDFIEFAYRELESHPEVRDEVRERIIRLIGKRNEFK